MRWFEIICWTSAVLCVLYDTCRGQVIVEPFVQPPLECPLVPLPEFEPIAYESYPFEVVPSPPEVVPIPPGYAPSPLAYESYPVDCVPSPPEVVPIPPGYAPSPPAVGFYPFVQQPLPIPCPEPLLPPPCNNCYDICLDVPTLDLTLPESVASSPSYQVAVTMYPGEKPLDSSCLTYFAITGNLFLQCIVYVYCDATYSVSISLISGTEQPGLFRVQGLEDESGVSSFVTNVFAFGSVLCENCSTTEIDSLISIYNCPIFADCSLVPPNATQQPVDLYVLANMPGNLVPTQCVEDAVAQFTLAGFEPGDIMFPPYQLEPICVTRLYNAPCINIQNVPLGRGIVIPTPQVSCGGA